MKKLKFKYDMELSFSSPVSNHHFQLRCIPSTGPRQQIVDVEMEISPNVHLNHLVDSFRSVVVTGFIPQPHNFFGYSVSGVAFVDNENKIDGHFNPLYCYKSSLTTPGNYINNLLNVCKKRISFNSSCLTPLEKSCEIMDEVYHSITYKSGSTTIKTTAEEALAKKNGVCQDYAHIMLAICRDLKIPARYIAGMLGGEGATHAWVEIYDNNHWIGLDPTHNRLVNDNYITIAHGRDYRDCMLDIGVFSAGIVTQTQKVNVSVHESDN